MQLKCKYFSLPKRYDFYCSLDISHIFEYKMHAYTTPVTLNTSNRISQFHKTRKLSVINPVSVAYEPQFFYNYKLPSTRTEHSPVSSTLKIVKVSRDSATRVSVLWHSKRTRHPFCAKADIGVASRLCGLKKFPSRDKFPATCCKPPPLSRNDPAANEVASKFQGSSANDTAEDRVSRYR